jgi:L-fuconolactonase
VAERAKEEPRLRGIVAWAPLEHGEIVRSYLAALKEISPLIKGVRRIAQGESDAQFSTRPSFIKGVQLLAEFGFSCDLCIKHTQLSSTIELVRQCPKVNFMLDHIAKPNIKEHVLEPWRAQLKELAALPNVVCKMSGIVTEADPQWTPADLKPYVDHVLECFGEDRVAFGGDWPVALLGSKYDRWVKALDDLRSCGPRMRARFTDSARRDHRPKNERSFFIARTCSG